jgi:hypothetical protein
MLYLWPTLCFATGGRDCTYEIVTSLTVGSLISISLCLDPSDLAVGGGQACSGHEAGRWSAGSEQAACGLAGSADGGKGCSKGVLLLTPLASMRGIQRSCGATFRRRRGQPVACCRLAPLQLTVDRRLHVPA